MHLMQQSQQEGLRIHHCLPLLWDSITNFNGKGLLHCSSAKQRKALAGMYKLPIVVAAAQLFNSPFSTTLAQASELPTYVAIASLLVWLRTYET